MKRYPSKITFRPTQRMYDFINDVAEKSGIGHSEVMRMIVSDYISFVKQSLENNHST